MDAPKDGMEGVNGGVDGGKMKGASRREELTLYSVLHRMASMIFVPDSRSDAASLPVMQRIKACVSENGPLLKDASRDTGRKIVIWTRRGSPLRALLVISLGSITFVTLTGLLVFMLFFLAATVNAIVVSLLISLAAAGGFLALFFACVTAVYIGALSIAVFVISTATISAIIAVLIATGWIGFLCTVWLVTKKSLAVAKHSLNMTGSAISAYSSARHRHYHEVDKVLD
ncbi:uncharacterized protein LOC8258727 [Ricinus communis]|uniref:Uncharacterized protein n=1 Tax=Ricinus communis TaxID=3988 RepID=B9SR82_RICCO|nr:uncharacterized protein LOC8258727 [Ricinus communis]XP_015580440.1 uncharacterized protein LOC8258727 [Ricinus communis]XP_048230739.1 uncharacterized protein LOC8258727 [Ricinus communis]EEF33870.1 conserved hypothetical protein [Ricinus communis]|eukprot:XP_002528501.1 uncharacterized protein LOC8258727 [Ricinus communis]